MYPHGTSVVKVQPQSSEMFVHPFGLPEHEHKPADAYQAYTQSRCTPQTTIFMRCTKCLVFILCRNKDVLMRA